MRLHFWLWENMEPRTQLAMKFLAFVGALASVMFLLFDSIAAMFACALGAIVAILSQWAFAHCTRTTTVVGPNIALQRLFKAAMWRFMVFVLGLAALLVSGFFDARALVVGAVLVSVAQLVTPWLEKRFLYQGT